MTGRKAWGAILMMAGIMMMYVSMTEDVRIFNDADGIFRAIPAISLVLSVWILISARLNGYRLARWLHDLRVLGDHGLSRRHALIGRPFGLAAGLLVSGVVLLTGIFLAIRLLSLLLLGLFFSSLLGSFAMIMFALLSGPSMLVGWYLLDRVRVDRAFPGQTVTGAGTKLMRSLDRVERQEKKATNAIVSTMDATQSGLRYARKMIRKGRR